MKEQIISITDEEQLVIEKCFAILDKWVGTQETIDTSRDFTILMSGSGLTLTNRKYEHAWEVLDHLIFAGGTIKFQQED